MKKALPLLVCALAACAPADEQPQTPVTGNTGMNLRSDILADTDVAGMSYAITQVDCDSGAALEPAVVFEANRDLEDILLPGGHPGFANQPFDADSEHLFADHFQVLPEGCWDVTATPVDADGQASDDCAPATQSGVEVIDGQVTEVILVSQCENDPMGALDALVALNHAPQISDVAYDPSKFTCTNQTQICVSATDPDNDPLRFAATAGDDVVVTALPVEIGEDGTHTQCFDIEVAGPGQYNIELAVFDQMRDGDALVDVERLLAEGQTSRDTLTVPVHAMEGEACICDCPEGFALNAAGDACERYAEAPAQFNGDPLAVCEGDDRPEYGARGATFPGGGVIQNPFFGQNFEDSLGRLNDIGIWSCNPVGNQWIGFSTCLEVEEEGEYVLGTAGDDFTRVIVDGQEVFLNNGQDAFRRWWMIPITLTPGTHVVELQGRDSGGVAATLGADIYGPFPAGSTVDDAAMMALNYEDNILWTTGDQLGGFFDTGLDNGYSCPDGFSLNLCGGEPFCSSFQQVACGE